MCSSDLRFAFDLEKNILDPIVLYRTLRNLSPVPFGGYLDCGEFSLISNSPERFLRLEDGIVQTRPMKGRSEERRVGKEGRARGARREQNKKREH